MTSSLRNNITQVDVLVIGLGPAGARSASVAAQCGCSVIAVDKRTRPGMPVQCAEYVPQALRSYGIDQSAIVQPIESMCSVLPSGEFSIINSSGLMLHRAQFDTVQIDRARRSGVRIEQASLLKQLDVADRTARVRTPAGDRIIRYGLLIAADGARSSVARLAGRAPLQTLRTQQYSVPLRQGSMQLDVRLSSQYPGGYGWIFPKGNVANIGVGFVTRRASELKQALMRLTQMYVERGLVEDRILGRTGGDIPVSGMRDDLANHHIVFAGDAAGLTHPISGAGIAPAVVSGELAGHCVAEYLYGDGASALRDYVDNLRDVYLPVLSRALRKRQQWLNAMDSHRKLPESVLRQCWSGFAEYYH